MEKADSHMLALSDEPMECAEARKLRDIGRQRSAWRMVPRFEVPIEVPERESVAMWEGVSTPSMRLVEHQIWLADRMNYAVRLLSDSIEVHGDIRSGVPVLRGTRVPLSQVLAEIADGASIIEIADDLEINENAICEFIRGFSVLVDRPFA